MIVYPICSSSKANSTYISTDEAAILVDAGLGIKNTFKFLESNGFSRNKIKAIFITHEHIDHVYALYNITKALSIPIYASKETLEALILKNRIYPKTKLYEINKKKAHICDMEISAFKTPHDCANSLGFSVSDGIKTASICTDLGHISPEIESNLKSSNFVMLESNYDLSMLEASKYPYTIKQRIKSKFGHLSNDEVAIFIEYLIANNVKKFVLAHLSQNNNLPNLALQTIISHLLKKNIEIYKDYTLSVAPVRNTDKIYEV